MFYCRQQDSTMVQNVEFPIPGKVVFGTQPFLFGFCNQNVKHILLNHSANLASLHYCRVYCVCTRLFHLASLIKSKLISKALFIMTAASTHVRRSSHEHVLYRCLEILGF